jgi:hypothetical protein
MLWFVLIYTCSLAQARDAGILYEVWHAPAAWAMTQVKQKGI